MEAERDLDSVRRVDYAECHRELTAESEAGWLAETDWRTQRKQPPLCAGRRNNRPFCRECIDAYDYLQRAAARDGRLRAFAGQLLTEGR